MRGVGNMTNVEKQMNRDDLIAYKNYDNKQYAMVPGISKEKNFLDRTKLGSGGGAQPESRDSPNRNTSTNKFHAQQERLKIFGHTRDVRDLRNQSVDRGAINNST